MEDFPDCIEGEIVPGFSAKTHQVQYGAKEFELKLNSLICEFILIDGIQQKEGFTQ